ncbi:sialic acid-binding Ig-like lectin 14 [Archocentrus centrarchus]|uniref:sialic acid-binding Ig-like lectin 14 n=1 Tax=Archocentrus centrarchus TaxID=63155 RepID=UPI0011E9CCAA|nr:sialic acid-binding Ig-like lectin 14 [Archocentrus centrarchus]
MFVLFWATLLFCVSGSNADTGTSRQCNGEYCITLSDGLLTAEAGLCVVIPCSFQTAYGFTPQNLVWYKCKLYRRCYNDDNIIFDSNNKNHQSEFQGRVSLLEPDVRQNNCSIIINDLRESDSGSYELRVNGKQDGFTFPARATVSIGGLTQKPRIKIPPMTEGQQATLTCTAPGLCSGSIPEVSWTWRGAGGTESYITGNSTSFRTKAQTAFSQRHIATLTFNSSAEHHNTNITCKIRFTGEKTTEASSTLKVNSKRTLQITGNTTVKEGDVLNLTCSIESFPPALIVWSALSSKTDLQSGTYTDLNNDTGSATLVIHNVTAEHSGQYICTAKHLNTTIIIYVSVTLDWFSKIHDGSGCVLQAEVLTCVCISEGFPLPTIKWPLLKNHNEYSVITTVTNHTVNSTVSLTVRNHGNSTVECVSNNGNGDVKENLLIHNLPKKAGNLSVNGVILLPIAVVSMLVNVIFLICFAFLWNSRKKMNAKDKDSTYMSLQKTHRSPEYDVICQPLN